MADAGAGIVAAPEDPRALQEAIVALAGRADRDHLGAAGRGIAVRDYDRRRIVERLASYLAEVAGAGR